MFNSKRLQGYFETVLLIHLAGMGWLHVFVWLHHTPAADVWQGCCFGVGSWSWTSKHCSFNVCRQNFRNRFYILSEFVFKRPRALHFHMPPALEIEQLNCVKLLGVLFQDNLKMDCHVHSFLSRCAQRMYLLKLLQHQGMPLSWGLLCILCFSHWICPPCMGWICIRGISL